MVNIVLIEARNLPVSFCSNAIRHSSGRVPLAKRVWQRQDNRLSFFSAKAKDSNGLCDPYVRFRLGNEKYKSRVVFRCLNPVYYEQFDLHTYPTQTKVLEISVYDNNSFSDEFIGKNAINLNCLNKEETHELIVKLDGLENAELLLLLTISGIKHIDEANNNSDYNFLEHSYVGFLFWLFFEGQLVTGDRLTLMTCLPDAREKLPKYQRCRFSGGEGD